MRASPVKYEAASGRVRMKKKRPRSVTTRSRPDARGPRPMPVRNTPQSPPIAIYADRPARIVDGEPRERTIRRELVVCLYQALLWRFVERRKVAPIDHLAWLFALRTKVGAA